MASQMRSQWTSTLVLLTAFAVAGCAAPAEPVEKEEETKPYQPIEKMIGEPSRWEGSVGSLQVQYVSRFASIGCYLSDAICLPGRNEFDDWQWTDGINKLVINLTWNASSPAAENLALAVRMQDFSDWSRIEEPEEIAYEEGPSPLQVVLEGDVLQKRFTIRVEVPDDDQFVMEQDFVVEMTRWSALG